MDKTIFVVDDSASNLALAEEALESFYQVITFSTSAKMFAALKKIKPSLFLLDIEMPDQDGFEVLKKLKDNDAHTDIPVLFLTALIDPANEAYGLDLGAAGYIKKPFSASHLLEKVKEYTL